MSLRNQKIEYISLQVIREICEEFHVNFSVLGIADFLKIEQRGVTLLLDADIEPILYGDIFGKRIAVDGSEVSKCIDDKMSVYRLLLQSSKIKQPQTEPIHNHKDLSEALSRIPSQLVVIKPRSGGHSSRNVLIIDRQRFTDLRNEEMCNFHNCIVQEYIPSWPPKEWRLHFVGQTLCRCLQIIDKNNWMNNFKINDIAINDLPSDLLDTAKNAACLISSKRCSDNFTIDFLESTTGEFHLLEANCGALGSFYIDDFSKKPKIEPIFARIFWRNFKVKKL